ncbi:unnamed protein product [Triticum turgidum subsp. durum]|uniref:Gamma-secretase subunit PEN-2 n=1 Tax=Triticum turgidum subsp. durum TaxID=4567 RepID=A0A9R1SAG7_TRITD|nr:unnamed protein product [Triticum turgidum subsp. durum]
MEARVAAGVPADEESGLLPRARPPAAAAAGRRPSSSSAAAPRRAPPPAVWATVDGPLGMPLEEAEGHARRFFLWGFACLPFLWAINCCYVVRSAVGFTIFAAVLLTWATTFIVGGERLFGPVWKDLVMYNVAEKLGLTGFMG